MGYEEAQVQHDKLKGLLEALSAIGAKKDKMLDGAEAALKGVGNAEAMNSLELNLCGMRRNVLSELAGITKHFGG
jgi:hypothetical protein